MPSPHLSIYSVAISLLHHSRCLTIHQYHRSSTALNLRFQHAQSIQRNAHRVNQSTNQLNTKGPITSDRRQHHHHKQQHHSTAHTTTILYKLDHPHPPTTLSLDSHACERLLTHLRVSFFLFRANSLLPFSSESRNITNSSTAHAAGTSATRVPTYPCSEALARSSVAGSRTPLPDGGRGRRGSTRAGKRPCKHECRFWNSW